MITPALLQGGLSLLLHKCSLATTGRYTLAATLPVTSASHSAILTNSSRVSHLFRTSSQKEVTFRPHSLQWAAVNIFGSTLLTALTKLTSLTVWLRVARIQTYHFLEGDDSGSGAVSITCEIEFQA
jgi:hypothetical protein